MKNILFLCSSFIFSGCTIFEKEILVQQKVEIYNLIKTRKLFQLPNGEVLLFVSKDNFNKNSIDECSPTYLGSGFEIFKLSREGDILSNHKVNDFIADDFEYVRNLNNNLFWAYNSYPQQKLTMINLDTQKVFEWRLSSKLISNFSINKVCFLSDNTFIIGGLTEIGFNHKYILAKYKDGKLVKKLVSEKSTEESKNVLHVGVNKDNTITVVKSEGRGLNEKVIIEKYSADLELLSSKKTGVLIGTNIFETNKLYFFDNFYRDGILKIYDTNTTEISEVELFFPAEDRNQMIYIFGSQLDDLTFVFYKSVDFSKNSIFKLNKDFTFTKIVNPKLSIDISAFLRSFNSQYFGGDSPDLAVIKQNSYDIYDIKVDSNSCILQRKTATIDSVQNRLFTYSIKKTCK